MVVVLSKEMFEMPSAAGISCGELLHPWTDSCFMGALNLALHGTVGSSKFFLLIYLLQSIMKRKQINKKFIKNQILGYARSVSFLTTYLFIYFGSLCLARKLAKRYYYYSFGFCGTLSGASIFIESNENRVIATMVFANFVMEALFCQLYAHNYLGKNLLRETLLFMGCSSILQYFRKTQKGNSKAKSSWFYYAPPSEDSKNAACSHKNSCIKYICKGFTWYFFLGCTVKWAKYIFTHAKMVFKNPIKMVLDCMKIQNIALGFLLGGYVGIHRSVCCILRNVCKKEEDMHVAIAGFFAGIAYLCKPSLSFLAMAVNTALQLSFKQTCIGRLTETWLPLNEIVFIFCVGLVAHNHFLLSDSCPQSIKNMYSAMTNRRDSVLYQNAVRTFEKVLRDTK